MDNITGKPYNSIENSQFTNINVEKINNKSVDNEINEQDELLIRVATLENTINVLILFINEHFNKTFEYV